MSGKKFAGKDHPEKKDYYYLLETILWEKKSENNDLICFLFIFKVFLGPYKALLIG